MEVRYVQPENRLAEMLVQPGGMTISALLERAAEGVESMRAVTLAAIDQKIEDIAASATSLDPSRFKVIRQYAGELFGDASAFGLAEIAFAAGSLHDLLEFDDAPPSTAAVKVHLDTIRALRRPWVSEDSAARKAVLAALHHMSHSIAAHAPKGAEAAHLAGSPPAPEAPTGEAIGLEANIRELKAIALNEDGAPPSDPSLQREPMAAARAEKSKREVQA